MKRVLLVLFSIPTFLLWAAFFPLSVVLRLCVWAYWMQTDNATAWRKQYNDWFYEMTFYKNEVPFEEWREMLLTKSKKLC